mmetsp:Transcript_13078/g.36192  ORF Transcript_13078/g.36192 Transcript_13078/m.36192 type:complete len:276 (-) Transcript_13078:539-1366(-)
MPLANHGRPIAVGLKFGGQVLRGTIVAHQLGRGNGHLQRKVAAAIIAFGPRRVLARQGRVPGRAACGRCRVGLEQLRTLGAQAMEMGQTTVGKIGILIGPRGTVGRRAPFVKKQQVVRLHDNNVDARPSWFIIAVAIVIVVITIKHWIGIQHAIIVQYIAGRIKDGRLGDGPRITAQDIIPIRFGTIAIAIVHVRVDLMNGSDVIDIIAVAIDHAVTSIQLPHIRIRQRPVQGKAIHGVAQQRRGRDGFLTHLRIVKMPHQIAARVTVPKFGAWH